MTTLLHIYAQVYEGGSPSWEPNGCRIFAMHVDADNFRYDEKVCVDTMKAMLAEASDTHTKYEYIDYALLFSAPIELNGFDDKFSEILKVKHGKVKKVAGDVTPIHGFIPLSTFIGWIPLSSIGGKWLDDVEYYPRKC